MRETVMIGVFALWVTLCLGSLGLGEQPFFAGLGDLPTGRILSFAEAVSGDGSVVVGKGYIDCGSDSSEGFVWTRGTGMVGLGSNLAGGCGGSCAYGVSDDGTIAVGGAYNGQQSEAFLWTEAGGMIGLDPTGRSFRSSTALDASGNGSAVAGYTVSGGDQEAFLWTPHDGLVGLGDLPGGDDWSRCGAISSDGSTVVGYSSSAASGTGTGAYEAFRWTEADGMVGLGSLPGGLYRSWGIDVSSDGSVVAGYGRSSAGTQAFRWTADSGMIGLGDLPGGGFGSWANAVSGDGHIVVGFSWALGDQAFIWDAVNGMRDLQEVLTGEYGLDLTGWVLNKAYDVSADGLAVVGHGRNPDGNQEAWVAYMPEPATLCLLVLGALAALKRKR